MRTRHEQIAALQAEIDHFDVDLLHQSAAFLSTYTGPEGESRARFERLPDVVEVRQSIASRQRRIAELQTAAALSQPGRTGGPHPVREVLAGAARAVAVVVATALPAAAAPAVSIPISRVATMPAPAAEPRCPHCGQTREVSALYAVCPVCWHSLNSDYFGPTV